MRKLLFTLFVLSGVSSFAQNDEVLMTIDGKPVYKSEFEYIFQKNNKDENITKEDLDEYVDLFTKFKLKVTEARAEGLDTMPKLVGELQGYRNQLSRQYLVDNEVTDKLMKEAYSRMTKELNASHILIKTPNSLDTLDAYKKALKLYERAKKGEDFAKLAKDYSEGPSAKFNGELGWFSGFRMVYKFESGAYNTPAGEVSKPVRTRFGYHVIKVNEVRDARPDLNISHILIHLKKDATEEDKEKAKKKINEIHALLQEGSDFKSLVIDYSDDKSTVKKSGNLGWIKSSNFYDEIIESAYELKENEAYSKPILTALGWHIVKRNNVKEIGSYEDNISYIKSKIQRDERGAQSRNAKVNSLKNEYAFKMNLKARKELDKIITKDKFDGTYTNEYAAKYKDILFSFSDVNFTQEDFLLNFFELNRLMPKQELNAYVENKLNGFIDRKIMNYEKQHLENKYPEFKSLMQEYTDGVLLFELTDQKVWSKAIKDTLGLKSFYETNKNDFMWEDRVDYEMYSSTSKKHVKKAFKMSKKGADSDSIMNYINKESELNVNYEEGLSESKNVEVLEGNDLDVKLHKPFENDGKYYVVNIKEKLAKQPKKLDEAKGLITSKYQDHLEKEWIKELNSKYEVKVNKDVLYSLMD